MILRLSKQDSHTCQLMGADTVKLCELQGFSPRLDNKKQSRTEANVYGFKAEFAIARLFNLDLPTVNVATIDAALDVVSKETPVLYAENQRITVILLTDWAFVK